MLSGKVLLKRQKITREEFRKLPEGPPHYEFERGELIPVTAPHERHQRSLLRLGSSLDTYVRENDLGRVWIEVDVELTDQLTYIPDIVFLSKDHLNRCHGDDGKIHGAPDLVVEILSKHSLGRDRIRKLNNYFTAGVTWYWIVDPYELTIEEYYGQKEGYLRTTGAVEGEFFRPNVFPGLELNLQELT